MRQHAMMCWFPSLCRCIPLYEVRLFGPGALCVQEAQWPFVAQGWDILLGPNGFRSWVSPRLPLSSSFIKHQKDTPSTWLRSRFPPEGNQRLLASHKAPGYHFAPLTRWDPSMYFSFYMHGEDCTGFRAT